MSIRLQTRVWDSVPLKGTELLLLLAIADHANEEGVCWPRQERLAERARCSVRQARRLLRDLESGGYISTTEGRGRGKVPVIQLHIGTTGNVEKPDTDDQLSSLAIADSGVPYSMNEVAKSGITENRTSSRLENRTSSVSENRTSEVTLQERDEEEKRTSSAPENAKSGVGENRTSEVTFQERIEEKHRTSSAPDIAKSGVGENRTSSVTERIEYSPERVKRRLEAMGTEAENRTRSAQKRTSAADNRTSSAQKPDIASHACVEPSKNHQLNHQETRASLLVPQLFDESDGGGADDGAETAPPSGAPKSARSNLSRAVSKFVGEVAEARAEGQPQDTNEERVETEQQRFFRVVAWVLGWEATALSKDQLGAVAQTLAALTKSGYAENDVRRFWSEIWLKDWRWTRNREHPRPSQLRSEIFRLRAAASLAKEVAPQSNHKDLTPEELELREKMREARTHGRYSPTSALRERVRVPNLQGHEMGLPDGQSEAS